MSMRRISMQAGIVGRAVSSKRPCRRARDRERRLRARRRGRPPSARARASRSRRRARSSPATRRRRRAGSRRRSGPDDSPEQHAQDIWTSSHETADMRLVETLTSEAPAAIHWLEELGRRLHARERRATGSPAAAAPRPNGCSRSATRRGSRSPRRSATRSSPARHRPREVAARRRSSRPRTAGGPAAASTSSRRRPSSSPPAAAASARRRSAASSRPTIPAPPAR